MRIYDIETLQASYKNEMACINQILDVIPALKEMIKQSDGKTKIKLNKLIDEQKENLSSWVYIGESVVTWNGINNATIKIIPKERRGADFYSREYFEPKMDGKKILADVWIEELEKLETRLKLEYVVFQENSKPERIQELNEEAIKLVSMAQNFNSKLDHINRQMFRLSTDMGQ